MYAQSSNTLESNYALLTQDILAQVDTYIPGLESELRRGPLHLDSSY